MEFMEKKGWRGAGILALALLFASGIALGQAQTGTIFAKATDDQGAALPGVNVTLTGRTAPVSQVTNVNGEARFPNLSPGLYTLDFGLQGFGKVKRSNVTVAVGQNTEIAVTMKLAGVQESIVVAGESPLLDTKKTGSQTTVSQVEMASVPTARDPWVILQTAPGVQIDRVNVGGSESGQQSQYVGKGSGQNQGTWNVDGVNITDMAALGSSPAYYDFDSFAELNIATGGSDAAIQTPGVQMNMVTKRGTNDVHGSARIFYEDKNLAATNLPEEMVYQQTILGRNPGSGNQIDQLQDYGAEIGGPVVKDLLWLWGSYSQSQINLTTAGGSPDKTNLKDYGLKLNLQAIPTNTLTGQYMDNDKVKLGRQAGPSRPPETTWDQKGPTKLYKVEDSQIFSADAFATVSYARVMGGFQLVSEGSGQPYLDANSVWHNGYYSEYIVRPQTQLTVTPSFFFRTGSLGHEIKAGFTYRKTPVSTSVTLNGGIQAFAADGFGADFDVAGFYRPYVTQTDLKTYNGYLSDTITVDKLTANIGVRYDYQWGANAAFTVPLGGYPLDVWPQVPLVPLAVPGTAPLTWKDFSPRIGLTYALGKDNKTIARASYARFYNQMSSGNVSFESIAPGGTYLYYQWNDKNGNKHVDPGEVVFTTPPPYYYGWDPAHPNSVTSSINKVNHAEKTPHTDEFLLGAEHELMPAFVVGLTGTYRKNSDLLYNARLTADGSRFLNPGDFTCTASGPYPVPNGDPQQVQVCNPKPGVAGVSRVQTNRPGYNQQYWGIDFSATKRYADKWMARFNFTWSDWKQHGLSEGQVDPSNLYGGTEAEGGLVAPTSGASGKTYIFINSKWQTTLSAMYTLPLDFNVSTSMFLRQGYPVPYYRLLASTGIPGASSKNYQLGAADLARLPTVFEWDLGLSKVIKLGQLNVTLQADVFNLLNRNTALQRTTRIYDAAGAPVATDYRDNNLYEIQSPRIWRFGARIAF
jgi:hypothetical protein